MTDEHLKRIALRYLAALAVEPEEHKNITPSSYLQESKEHAAWMCQRIIYFVEHDLREKAARWLGFVQCMVWHLGIYTIDALREHNKNG
jgi:hypothetical protein